MVRLSASCTGHLYPQEMFLVLIFTRGWVHPRAMVRSEGICHWKIQWHHRGINPRTVRLVAQRLKPTQPQAPHTYVLIRFLTLLVNLWIIFVVPISFSSYHGNYSHKQQNFRVCCILVSLSSLLVSPVCTLQWGVTNIIQLPPQIQGQMYAPKCLHCIL